MRKTGTNSSRVSRAGTWLLGVAAVLLFATGFIMLRGEAGQGGVEVLQRAVEPPVASEQRVFYADMLDAYEAGNLEEARQRARTHLANLGQRLLNPPHEIEKASICHGTLGVLKFMLMYENRLPVGQRFGAQQDLLEEIDRVFAGATRLRADLRDARPAIRSYLDTETGTVAAEWIRARQGMVARDRQNETFEFFRADLERAGFDSVDAVLAPPEAAAPQVPPFAELSIQEANQIGRSIDDYFQGLIRGDRALLVDATELDARGSEGLLQALAADYREGGVMTVHSITLPPVDAQRFRAQQGAAGEAVIATVVHGIELDVTMLDGTRRTMTIDKLVRLRRGLGGRWVVVTPRD